MRRLLFFTENVEVFRAQLEIVYQKKKICINFEDYCLFSF